MVEDGGRLMRVRTELVREHLVRSLEDAVLERFEGELDSQTDAALARAFELVAGVGRATGSPPKSRRLAVETARLGYLARVVETERFPPARSPMPWLAERMRDAAARDSRSDAAQTAAVRVSRELALAEPSGRPDPADDSASWRVPGPGGHVRFYLANATLAARCERDSRGEPILPRGAAAVELRRCWMFGFLLRCCEESGQSAPG